MEEKKALKIIFIVSGICLIAIVLGLVFFSPRNGDFASFKSSRSPATSQNIITNEWTRPVEMPQSQEAEAKDDAVTAKQAEAGESGQASVSATSSSGNVIFIYGDRGQDEARGTEITSSEDGQTIIDLTGAPRPKRPTLSEGASATDIEKDGEGPAVKSSPPQPATTASRPRAAAPARPVAKPAATKPAAKPAPAKPPVAKPAPLVSQYWIQTGAYSTKARADAVKIQLAEKSITSIVAITENKGKNLFRVRVGPYSTKSEADYWLSLIKTYEGFDDSYVSMTQTRK